MSFQLSFTIYSFIILGTVFIGLTFSLLLLFIKRTNQQANIFLGIAVLIITCWNIWVLAIDLQISRYFPLWSLIPLNFSLALGPSIYLYVKKLTTPTFQLGCRYLWLFSPLLIELTAHIAHVVEALQYGRLTFQTNSFLLLNPFLQVLAIFSVLVYLLLSLNVLRQFHKWVEDNYSDAYKYQVKWLIQLISIFAIFWFLWVPYLLIDYFFFAYQLGIGDYYPLYLLLAFSTIWIGAEAFLRPELIIVEPLQQIKATKEQPSPDLTGQSVWLQQQMETNLFYLNSQLTLRLLAQELEIHPNLLSKIINEGLGKNFSDFINHYRIESVIGKMQNPAYDHITLLGIAFESGFSSKATFNRTFKKLTGKTPQEFKQLQNKSV